MTENDYACPLDRSLGSPAREVSDGPTTPAALRAGRSPALQGIGLLFSWVLLILGVGVLGYAVAAEAITMSDAYKLHRAQQIGSAAGIRQQVEGLQRTMSTTSAEVASLRSEVASTEKAIGGLKNGSFVITVSTAENKVYARRDGQLVFEALCSTGKNTRLNADGETLTFRTPIGRFHILSKEENPLWVPPDWYFIEEARKNGLDVVRLERGQRVDDLYVDGNEVRSTTGEVLAPGRPIVRAGAVVIPPIGTRQRSYPDVLGTRRLNLGDGYALHGTQAVSQLGRNVSHGCVRLRNDAIARLYEMASVGDEVIIY